MFLLGSDHAIFFSHLLPLCLLHVLLDAIFLFHLYLVQVNFGDYHKPHHKYSGPSINHDSHIVSP